MARRQRKPKKKAMDPLTKVMILYAETVVIVTMLVLWPHRIMQGYADIIGMIGPHTSLKNLYWFQVGLMPDARNSHGGSVQIETVPQANVSSSAWIGEELSNGAFLQVGYLNTWATGFYYQNTCLNKTHDLFYSNEEVWFWQYYPPNSPFKWQCNAMGANDTLLQPGSIHTYAIRGNGSNWTVWVDNAMVDNVIINGANLTFNDTIAITLEDAQTRHSGFINTTQYSNFTIFTDNGPVLVNMSNSTRFIGYGVGSNRTEGNPYNTTIINNTLRAGSNPRSTWSP